MGWVAALVEVCEHAGMTAIETFCMSDHGIVADYSRSSDLRVDPMLAAPDNAPARAWGLPLYRRNYFKNGGLDDMA